MQSATSLDFSNRDTSTITSGGGNGNVRTTKIMTNERLLTLFDHYGIDSRDALIEHLHEQLTHMRIVHPIKDPQIDADRQAKERYEHLLRTTTSEERERDFHQIFPEIPLPSGMGRDRATATRSGCCLCILHDPIVLCETWTSSAPIDSGSILRPSRK